MTSDSIENDQLDRRASARLFSKLPTLLACIVLAAVAWKLAPASADHAERRAAQAEIDHCRDDQERMFMTPDRASAQGVKCAKLEADFQRRFP